MEDKWPLVLMLVVFATVTLVGMQKEFIKYRNTIEQHWSGFEVALRRKFNLLPDVVKGVSRYFDYEAGTIASVTERGLDDSSRAHRVDNAALTTPESIPLR